MNDTKEFFQIRSALLQANLQDYQEALDAVPQSPAVSSAHRRWEKKFLRNPAAFRRRRDRAPWAKALRTAACLMLAACLSCAALLATNAQAREWVARWITRENDTHTSYDFQGRAPTGKLDAWAPAYLPEGYVETEHIDLDGMVDIFYNTDDPEQRIHFSYQFMSPGSGEDLDNEHHTISDIFINDIYGQLYTATDDSPNMLVWFDESSGYSFFLAARLPVQELCKIAESIQIVK